MIDLRDEDLYRQYYIAWVTSGKCNTTDTADALAADALIQHRRRFPLLPSASKRDPAMPVPLGELWRGIIKVLWADNLSARTVVMLADGPADVLEPEIARLLTYGIIYERADGTLAIMSQYRTADPAEGMAKIAAALGGA